MLPEQYHVPVLTGQVLAFLVTKKDGTYIDATLGGGGHFRALAGVLSPEATLAGIDRDAEALEHCRRTLGTTVKLVQENFRNMDRAAQQFNIEKADGILMDLGVSSRQLDSDQRGFAYQHDQALDMRMDTRQETSAATVLNSYPVTRLAGVFRTFGEIRWGKRLAAAIEKVRPLRTTADLASVVEGATRTRPLNKVLSRVFQAVRIEVNQELAALEEALGKAVGLLNQGGRLVVISYHSLEDRIVKHFLKQQAADCVCPPRAPVCTCGKVKLLDILTRTPVTPEKCEAEANPRARSAKLRAAVKCN